MSHQINFRNGKASMLYVGEAPWHNLGTKLPKLATAKEALQVAQLDFDVVKVPAYAMINDAYVPVPNKFVTVRTDTNQPLGTVGKVYTPLQNRDAFVMFDALVGKDEAIYETAGVLGNGERVWILAKLPDYIGIKTLSGKIDNVEKYLLLYNSHDGSSVVRAKLTPIRVVCNNTLSFSLREHPEDEVRVRHTANATVQLEEASRLLGLVNKYYGDVAELFQTMGLKQVTGEQITSYISSLFPKTEEAEEESARRSNIKDSILELVEVGQGAEYTQGTLWGAYNAVTEYVDHVRSTRGKDKEESKLNSVWFGSGATLKKLALQKAVELIKA